MIFSSFFFFCDIYTISRKSFKALEAKTRSEFALNMCSQLLEEFRAGLWSREELQEKIKALELKSHAQSPSPSPSPQAKRVCRRSSFSFEDDEE